jgi:cytochrome c-type biogenesis protein
MQLTLPVVTTAAILDSINPCAISVLLLTIGFLLSLNRSKKEVMIIASTYIVGIFITYILIGLGVLQALSFFGIPRAISRLGALFIIASGTLSLLDQLIPNFPINLAIPSFIKPQLAKQMHKGSLAAMFTLGVLVGLFEFPCTGGPYLLILSLLHDKGSFAAGAMYLIYYNLIFVSPLVIILAIASNKTLLNRVQDFRKSNLKRADIITSLAMIILGIIILVV